MRVLITDDEPLAREILETHLQKLPGFRLAGSCKNVLEAFSMINKQAVDILLLDINMPEINGIDFLRTLKRPPLVIFTTAYSEYAVQSYELNAVDYLVKPVAFERFVQAMNKAANLLKPNGGAPAAERQAMADRMLFVRSDGKWIRIDLCTLWFVEGLKDYVKLWTNEGRITVHSTMKNFEEQLAPYGNFARVHKSHIVNMDYISEVGTQYVKIRDQQISIGNTYREEFNKLLEAYKFL